MKSLYEGTSRKKATLIITDVEKVVRARWKERKTSRRKDPVKWWMEEAPTDAPKYDKGKGGGPWSNYDSREAPRVR